MRKNQSNSSKKKLVKGFDEEKDPDSGKKKNKKPFKTHNKPSLRKTKNNVH